MVKTVGITQTLDLLREAVRGRGEDFVYPDKWRLECGPEHFGKGPCLYFTDDGEPACIVGFVLSKLGVKQSDLRGSIFSADVVNEWQDKVHFDTEAVHVLRVVQIRQDAGDTWGEAVRQGEQVAIENDWIA